MANRLFTDTLGFWDRVEEAIQDSGKTKIQLAAEIGVERKALTPIRSSNGQFRSWHSGRIHAFCKATGVSADWLMGLSKQKWLSNKEVKSIKFIVIDTKTGKEPILDDDHIFKEAWFQESGIIPMDIRGWVIDSEGNPILVDDCETMAYPPEGRFAVILV
jgi:hypothetical protein